DRSVAAARALAIALRRGVAASDDARAAMFRSVRERAAPGETEETLVWRTLARDPWVAPWLARSLSSHRPTRRAAAAFAIELLGPGGATAETRRALAVAIDRESDPEAFRREASALVAIDEAVAPDRLATA